MKADVATWEEIKKLSTRELLQLRDHCHMNCKEWDDESEPITYFKVIAGHFPNPAFDPTKPTVGQNQKNRNLYAWKRVHINQLLTELKTRPHVPNKPESRKLRQQKAKAGK